MNYKALIALWAVLAVSIVYWDNHRWEDKKPVSICHNTDIRMMNDRPMCTECKLFCEVVDGKR